MKKILYISAIIGLAVSCSIDETKDYAPNYGAKDAIVATIDSEVESRNSLVDKEGERVILWSIDDVIGVNSSEGETPNAQGVIDADAVGQPSGTFWFAKGAVAGDIRLAYYPYRSTTRVKDMTFTTVLPNVQTYVKESVFAPNVTVMVGKVDASGELRFVNSCAIVEFKLKGTQMLTSLVLKSASKLLAGGARVDASAEAPTLVIDAEVGEAFNTITLDLGAGVQLSAAEPTSFYFVVPAGRYNDFTLEANDSEGNTYYRDITNARAIEVRHIAPFSPFTIGELVTEGAVNLSADAGVSNCYMIPAKMGGRYYLEPQNIANSIDVTQVENMDILWHDNGAILGNLYFDKENKRLYFTTHGDSDNGSAIVSAFDKDGKVLWSWHIWVTDAEDQSLTTEKKMFLDRNLGARYSPKSAADVQAMTAAQAAAAAGFYYQLGRSNPFPGPKTVSAYDEANNYTMMNKYGYETTLFSTNTYAFINEKYKADFKFKNEFFVDATHKAESCATTPMSLWHGDTMEYLQTWASDMTVGGSDETWSATKKGHQDPCPQGYRAATFEELEAAYCMGNTIRYSHYGISAKAVTENNRPATYKDNYGGYAQNSKTNNSFVWIPMSGLRISYLKGTFDITVAKPSDPKEYDETGKLYFTGYFNRDSNGTPTLQSGYAYMRGIVTNISKYSMSANMHSDGGWKRFCKVEVCTPVLTMTTSGSVQLNVDNSNNARCVPFASATPVRCVKLQ